VNTNKILAFAAATEGATGLALMIAPALVVQVLVGLDVSIDGELVGRCFGIALVALALTCWPAVNASGATRAMLAYNGLIALYLTYVGAVLHLHGLLLWPAIALHAVVALLLIAAMRAA
jgi:hypothetical protein